MQKSMLEMSKQNEGYEIQSWAWITKLPSRTGPENLMIFKLGKNLMGVLQIPLASGVKKGTQIDGLFVLLAEPTDGH